MMRPEHVEHVQRRLATPLVEAPRRYLLGEV
jgi:hypothetical protein